MIPSPPTGDAAGASAQPRRACKTHRAMGGGRAQIPFHGVFPLQHWARARVFRFAMRHWDLTWCIVAGPSYLAQRGLLRPHGPHTPANRWLARDPHLIPRPPGAASPASRRHPTPPGSCSSWWASPTDTPSTPGTIRRIVGNHKSVHQPDRLDEPVAGSKPPK